MSSEIQLHQKEGAWLRPQSLDQAMILAQEFAGSGEMIPAALQGKPKQVLMAIVLAMSKGLDVYDVIQNTEFIKGRFGLRSQFMIQCANNNGALRGRILYKVVDTGIKLKIPARDAVAGRPPDPSKGEKYAVKGIPARPAMELKIIEYTAYATLATGETVEGPTISIKTAYEAGWLDQNETHWIGDTANMCYQRAAKRFINMYGIGIGVNSSDEIRDGDYAQEPAQDVQATVISSSTPSPATVPKVATNPAPETAPKTPAVTASTPATEQNAVPAEIVQPASQEAAKNAIPAEVVTEQNDGTDDDF